MDMLQPVFVPAAAMVHPIAPKGHLSMTEMATSSSIAKPTKRSYTASDVIKTLVLSAKLDTRRVTAMERIFPDMTNSPTRAMKQVRRATRGGDKLAGLVNGVVIVQNVQHEYHQSKQFQNMPQTPMGAALVF